MSKLIDALRRAEALRNQRLAEEAKQRAAKEGIAANAVVPTAEHAAPTTPPQFDPDATLINPASRPGSAASPSAADAVKIIANEKAEAEVDAEFNTLALERRNAEAEVALLQEEVELRKNQLREATATKRAAEQAALDAAREREASETNRDRALQEAIAAEERATNVAREREAAEREATNLAQTLAKLEAEKTSAIEARIETDRRAAQMAAKRIEESKERARKTMQHTERERAAVQATKETIKEHEGALNDMRVSPSSANNGLLDKTTARASGHSWLLTAVIGVALLAAGVGIGSRLADQDAQQNGQRTGNVAPLVAKSNGSTSASQNGVAPALNQAPTRPALLQVAAADEAPLQLKLTNTLAPNKRTP
jgi:trimeric autotransporter adhesin